MVSTGMAARRPASGVIDDSKKISFGDWKKLAVDGVPPCTRCARAFALGSQPSLRWSLLYRYSQATCVCGGTVFMYGGASSDEEGGTTYHSDLFLLKCEFRALT